jgi:hypothetical protein
MMFFFLLELDNVRIFTFPILVVGIILIQLYLLEFIKGTQFLNALILMSPKTTNLILVKQAATSIISYKGINAATH